MVGFNHTIDDSDPIFKYYPYGEPKKLREKSALLKRCTADGDDTGGWAPYFAGSGGFRNIQSEPGEYATGQSLHYTASSGSSVTLEFHGMSTLFVFVTVVLTKF